MPIRESQQEAISGLLDLLKVGGALDLPKEWVATKWMVYQYKSKRGGSFIVRHLKPGWTRIWRVK